MGVDRAWDMPVRMQNEQKGGRRAIQSGIDEISGTGQGCDCFGNVSVSRSANLPKRIAADYKIKSTISENAITWARYGKNRFALSTIETIP